MSRRTSLIGAATVAALSLAPPSAATAAVTGTISAPCYSHIVAQDTQPVVVGLTGGTPGAGFVMAATAPGKGLGSQGSTSGNFDAAGNAIATIESIFPPSGSIDPLKGDVVAITIKDFGVTPAVDTLLGQTLITNLGLDVSTTPRNPRAKRTVRVSGTPFAGKKLYGFVVKGTSRKILKRFSIGTGNVCGYASTKAVVAPKTFRHGTYRLYVNAGTKLDKPNAIMSGFRIF
jgi:hypothetical protein